MKSKEKIISAVLWNDYHEDSLYEMIDYLKEYEELSKEEIIGQEVEFCEKASVYEGEDYYKIQDIIYSESDIYCDEYFQDKRREIMELIESVKYLQPFKKYIITEEDYNEVIRDL